MEREERARRAADTAVKSRSRRKRSRRSGVNPLYVIALVAVIALVVVIIVGVRSCGSEYKSPKAVVRTLVQAGVEGKAKIMKKCYGITGDTPTALQEEIDATIAYYAAHGTQEMKVVSCDTLFNEGDTSYVYIIYNLVLENEQEFPCIGTYMTKQNEEKYYVLPSTQITDELAEKARTAYEKLMSSEDYKNYVKAYDTFIKKNPGYEEKIASKLI